MDALPALKVPVESFSDRDHSNSSLSQLFTSFFFMSFFLEVVISTMFVESDMHACETQWKRTNVIKWQRKSSVQKVETAVCVEIARESWFADAEVIAGELEENKSRMWAWKSSKQDQKKNSESSLW